MSKDFITIQEAAEYLGKSAQTIRRMIKRGDLNAKRIKTPQGFHYVLPREEIEFKPKVIKPMEIIEEPKEIDEKPMLHKTIVENPSEPQIDAAKPNPTSQNELLTRQQPIKQEDKAKSAPIDKSQLIEVLNRHHKENMLMLRVIDHLQRELDHERRRPKTLAAYFFDWLSH